MATQLSSGRGRRATREVAHLLPLLLFMSLALPPAFGDIYLYLDGQIEGPIENTEAAFGAQIDSMGLEGMLKVRLVHKSNRLPLLGLPSFSVTRYFLASRTTLIVEGALPRRLRLAPSADPPLTSPFAVPAVDPGGRAGGCLPATGAT